MFLLGTSRPNCASSLLWHVLPVSMKEGAPSHLQLSIPCSPECQHLQASCSQPVASSKGTCWREGKQHTGNSCSFRVTQTYRQKQYFFQLHLCVYISIKKKKSPGWPHILQQLKTIAHSKFIRRLKQFEGTFCSEVSWKIFPFQFVITC